MKQRSILFMIFMTIITVGLYEVYWYIKFQMELKNATGDGFGGLGHFLASIFTFGIYGIYWQFAAGRRLAKQGASDWSVLYLILTFTPAVFLNPYLMQYQANNLKK
ncbi:MAG TPA: DUF4234 domain-containing protein [Clostridia bacterium]